MIHGIVNQRCEATFPVAIGKSGGQRQFINAVIYQ